ncbi:MAG: c-type cytochrome [Acidobacteriota bacterium]
MERSHGPHRAARLEMNRRPSRRLIALVVLIAIYLGVSIVAYTDFPRRDPNVVLSDLECRGQLVWRRENCQVCHQLYGFGGFLGPDLTNRVDDATPADTFSQILQGRSGKMPALHLGPSDQRAVLAYLRAVNRTGRSQPRRPAARRRSRPPEQFAGMIAAWVGHTGQPLDSPVRRGFAVWSRNRCSTCHVPFTLGWNRAPDLSQRALDRSESALKRVLEGDKAKMPSFALGEDEVRDLRAFLGFLAHERATLVRLNDELQDREPFSWGTVPRFEYR